MPVAGESGVVRPVRGTVLYRLPGSSEFIHLPDARNLPNGTEVDATRGFTEIFVSKGNGAFDSVIAWAGRFSMSNRRVAADRRTGSTTLTELNLSGPLGECGTATRQRSARASRRRARKLWTKTRQGRFRTRGKFASATVRGTRWLTRDFCDSRGGGTSVFVQEGVVQVEDLLRDQSSAVRAGNRVTVRPNR